MKTIKSFGGRVCALLFIMAIFFCQTQAFAEKSNAWKQWQAVITEEQTSEDNLIQSLKNSFAVELWHYSGGYWGNDFVRINDSQVFDDADALAEAVNAVMDFQMPLPQEVIDLLNDGYNVDIVLSADGIPLDDIFNTSKGFDFKYEDNNLIFKAYPKFNFDKRYNYKDTFISGLHKAIPFVVAPYGYNKYAMWTRNGSSVGAADGYFNPDNPYELGASGIIHPSQIADSSGNLQSDLYIYVDRENGTFEWRSSNNLAVGYHTFANAGAVAVHFDYPISISFYKGGKMSDNPLREPNGLWGNPNTPCDDEKEPILTPPDDSSSCGETIKWTEKVIHKKRKSCRKHGYHEYDCTHYYTYEASLTVDNRLSPKILKSGYGFDVSVDTSVETKLVNHTGGCNNYDANRSPEKKPQAPTKADVKLGYTVTNVIGTQGSVVSLECNQNSGASTSFITAQNPISALSSRNIYTDVALQGTADNPQTHNIEVYIYGGGVNGVEFCKTLYDSFTINGSMYDDDGTTS